MEFIEFKKEGVWLHFLREKCGQSAQCKLCKTILKTVGGSTKGLHEHLKRRHDVTLKRKAEDDGEALSEHPTPKARKTATSAGPMTKFLLDRNENTLQAVIARMTARDGLPFRVFTTSHDLRRGLTALGLGNLPTSAESVKQLVINQGRRIRSFVMEQLSIKKKLGERFSLTFDEWTSARNRRYMNVNVHSQAQYWSLGLIRVHGSMPAEKCITLLQEKLTQFNLSLEHDIVCICTDGASVMTKVGKLLPVEQQLCYAHAIQLAVLDVLYSDKRKRQAAVAAVEEEASVVDNDGDVSGNYDSDADDNDGDGFDVIDESPNLLFQLSDDYKEVVNKVRSIVKMFRRSPTKNDDTLQPYIRREFGTELVLLLDCRTRWSSLADMLSRFVKLRGPIRKALIDLSEPTQVTDGDFCLIEEMVACLEPVKIAVKAICRRDTNLIAAEAALHFCIIQLQKQSSELAKTLAEAIECRLKGRRAVHAGVLQYLQSNTARETASDVFPVPSNAVVRKFVQNMVKRLDYSEESNVSDSQSEATAAAAVSDPDPEEHRQESSSDSFAQQLEIIMRQSVASTSASVPQTPKAVHDGDKNLLASIKAEMAVYDSTGKRGRCLQQVYEYLLSCPPTSVEAERAFSAAGVLCTKLRTRLADSTLDTLCFLRSYYRE